MIDYNEYFKNISSYTEFKMKTAMLGKKVSDKDILNILPKVGDGYRYIIENGSPVWINNIGLKEDNPKIKTIKNSAFYCCNKLMSITIPSSVKSIDVSAFSYCQNLKSITIPDNVKSIGMITFAFCNNLTTVTIPKSLTFIDIYAFHKCRNLKIVYLPKHLKKFKNCFPSQTKIIYT